MNDNLQCLSSKGLRYFLRKNTRSHQTFMTCIDPRTSGFRRPSSSGCWRLRHTVLGFLTLGRWQKTRKPWSEQTYKCYSDFLKCTHRYILKRTPKVVYLLREAEMQLHRALTMARDLLKWFSFFGPRPSSNFPRSSEFPTSALLPS
jgi:hypothetical protein